MHGRSRSFAISSENQFLFWLLCILLSTCFPPYSSTGCCVQVGCVGGCVGAGFDLNRVHRWTRGYGAPLLGLRPHPGGGRSKITSFLYVHIPPTSSPPGFIQCKGRWGRGLGDRNFVPHILGNFWAKFVNEFENTKQSSAPHARRRN